MGTQAPGGILGALVPLFAVKIPHFDTRNRVRWGSRLFPVMKTHPAPGTNETIALQDAERDIGRGRSRLRQPLRGGGEQGCIAIKAEPGDKNNWSFGGKLSP